jgi:hypothetical protein
VTAARRLGEIGRSATPRQIVALVPVWALVIGGAVALAGLSLLMPSAPSFDPTAWLVWGRELATPSMTFSIGGGPSWKPLPVLVTTVFALAGGAAPGLWLIVARAAALLALVGAFVLGRRLGGRWAGAVAAVALLLTSSFVSISLRGASEPLLIASVLWGIEWHLAGRRDLAYAMAVAATLMRPEAGPWLLAYSVVLWRHGGRLRRTAVLAGLALVPLLWIGVPALTGDAFSAGRKAAEYDGGITSDPGGTALRRGLSLAPALVWALALAAVALRPHDRRVRALALLAVAWLAIVVAMTIGGFPGLTRFMFPAAALACVLAGVGAVALAARAGSRPAVAAAAVLLLAAGVAFSSGRATGLRGQVQEAIDTATAQRRLDRAIAAAGGREAIADCGVGSVATSRTMRTALAWKLRVPLSRVRFVLAHSGTMFSTRRSKMTGSPPQNAVPLPRTTTVVARVPGWTVRAVVSSADGPVGACGGGVRTRPQNTNR